MERLKESLRDAPVVDRGDYQYFVHPVTDGLPAVDADLLREVARAIADATDLSSVDKVIAPEAMGIHHATALTLETGVPFVVARKREYGFDGEVAVHQETGYGEGELYVNNVEAGDRVVIVDDVLSTGGTLEAVCQAVESIGAELVDVVVVLRRVGEDVPDFPVEPTALVTVDVVDGEVVIVDDE